MRVLITGENEPLVSVIVPFYNTPLRFMIEAIQSVFGQIYQNWELWLIDDGSTGPDSKLAISYAQSYPDRIFYLEHSGHANRGLSASRNLGIKHANGDFIAFLDSDDIWMPEKLVTQVLVLETNPVAGMAYANSRYWYSWNGSLEDIQLDFVPKLGVESGRLYDPPSLLPLFLDGRAAVPCVNSLLVRKDAFERVGGCVESFRTLYEDQAFYAKLCLAETIYVSDDCLDWYRQHPSSLTAVAQKKGSEYETRGLFLLWLKNYLIAEQIRDYEVWKALRREIWRLSFPRWLPKISRLEKTVRWAKKWILKTEAYLLPELIRKRLWIND